MNQTRKLVPLLETDPAVSMTPTVGVWVRFDTDIHNEVSVNVLVVICLFLVMIAFLVLYVHCLRCCSTVLHYLLLLCNTAAQLCLHFLLHLMCYQVSFSLVNHPMCWAACIRYLSCDFIKDRKFTQDETFLLVR